MSAPAKFVKADAALSRIDLAMGLKPAAANSPSPDRDQCIKAARRLLAPALAEREPVEYPIDALGPLADACAAISDGGQVQPAMAGQCLLGAASLLTQGLWNVESMTGPVPLSLYLGTLGDSGEGRTTAQAPALRSVTEWQRSVSKKHRAALAEHAEEKRHRKRGGDAPADPPSAQYRLVSDATVEGLRRDLDAGLISQGVFTDEAAAILCGYGMSTDHRAKSSGVFSKLWDNGLLSVARVVGGRVERPGCRLAMHWLVQPMAAAESVGDPMLSHLGFWPRFLVAWPAPMPPRLARPFNAGELPAVRTYWRRCEELLAMPLGEDATDAPVIGAADDGRELMASAFERFEIQGRRGMLRSIKPFALRATEQAFRVAGVLSAFAGSDVVTRDTAAGALRLVGYSLDTWRVLIEEGAASGNGGRDALRLYEWLTDPKHCPTWQSALPDILTRGPAGTRTKDKRDAVIAHLRELRLVEVSDRVVMALAPPPEVAS